MNERPKIKIEKSITDRMVEFVVYGGVAISWIYVILHYGSLEDTIPVHFNVSGQADGFGSKASIWWLPAVCTVLVAMMQMLSLIPHTFNYPITINSANAEKQYRLAIQMLRYLSLSIVIIFLILEITTVESARNDAEMGGAWMLPVILLVTLTPIAFFVYKMFSNKTHS